MGAVLPGLVPTPRTASLSDDHRRVVAAWADDCADRVLDLFERDAPDEPAPRDGIERARAHARGDVDAASQIRVRFVADEPPVPPRPLPAGPQLEQRDRPPVSRTSERTRSAQQRAQGEQQSSQRPAPAVSADSTGS